MSHTNPMSGATTEMSSSTSMGALSQMNHLSSLSYSQKQSQMPQQRQSIRLSPMQISEGNRRNMQLDANILSRMVTASNGVAGAGNMPIRMASIQDFRRSLDNPANPTQQAGFDLLKQPPSQNSNQPFSLSHRRSSDPQAPDTASARGPMMNAMLKMLEERMEASENANLGPQNMPMHAGPVSSPVKLEDTAATPDQQAALQASINKWAGIGNRVEVQAQPKLSLAPSKSFHKSPVMPSVSETYPMKSSYAPQVMASTINQGQGYSMTTTYNTQRQSMSTRQHQILQQLILEQQQASNQQCHAQAAPNGLTRCAVSLAKVDRLRQQNQSVQLLQQQALQNRINDQYMRQRSIAASVLESSKQNSDMHQVSTHDIAKNYGCYRKRNSHNMTDDEDDEETTCTTGSHTPSISSHASSTSKVRRSSYANFSASMENLLIRCQSFNAGTPVPLSSINTRNESFSSGMNTAWNQAGFNIGSNAVNESFSVGLEPRHQSYHSGLNSSQLHGLSRAPSARKKKSSALINSMLATQSEIHQHLATQLQVATNSAGCSSRKKSPTPTSKVGIDHHLNGQPKCSDKIIMSDLPDRIKYQNAQAESKPIDVVKQALESRGVASSEVIKPSFDMPEDFFVQSCESYCQEAVDAIRSNSVDSLRKLFAGGTNLQCANKFGESLIHLACRRSHRDVVSFLVNEAGVSLRVRDDYGRTPFHDACWRSDLDLELIDMLLEREPKLLMLCDKRGHSPLDYTRRCQWAELVPFLQARSEKFVAV